MNFVNPLSSQEYIARYPMKNFNPFLFYSLSLLFICSTNTEVFAQEQAVFAAEAARFQAQIEKNGVALQQLLADDLYYLHSNGLVEDKADFISSVTAGKIVYSSMNATEQRLRLFGKTAILYGLVLVEGLYKGKSFSLGLHYTSVYRKKRGKWLLLNWQSTAKP